MEAITEFMLRQNMFIQTLYSYSLLLIVGILVLPFVLGIKKILDEIV